MPKFKFDNLDSQEFEKFCKDILEFETSSKFRTYRKGRDGGIDIKCLINDSNWIGQVKYFMYSNMPTIKQTLIEERTKLDKLKPSRYSLFLSVDITPSDEKDILEIMSPYLDRQDLYTISNIEDICFKDEFSSILYNKYSNLFMPPLFLFERYIQKDINEIQNLEDDNIEIPEDISEALKCYIAQKILNSNFETESLNKIEQFIIAIFDWVLCNRKFPNNLISTFVLENKNLNKLFLKRWEIIEYYFEGQLEKAIQEIDKLLKEIHKDTKENWLYVDLLIDKRCLENTVNIKEKHLKYDTAQKELFKLSKNCYYPII